MGKRSIRENKNIYQLSREALDLTREQAGELLEFISPDKIEKIESEKMLPHPEDVLAMSKAYKTPQLCNYYCSHECPIGQIYVPELQMKDLSGIILEMIATLNRINKEKDRLIEITADGQITEDEYEDFKKIRSELSKISMSVDTLSLWVDKSIADGKISDIINE
ncbi:MAG: helix-turn-helix domain-containing protein [Lachnospiraceae bacterium]|nr:helix-turn-helix domain-containing protein [Lachnospiraceae bacterium]